LQTQITPNNKLASFGTIGLLFLAGIAGMVFLLPAAHAASATVALSATSGTVGGAIIITGNGFNSGSPIEIYSTSGTSSVSWFTTNLPVVPNNCGGAFSGAYGGIGTGNSLFVNSGAAACLTTTATGMFETTVNIPALPGGANTIVVSDGTNTVSTSFTITPSISIAYTGTHFGYPEQTISAVISVTGFGSGESVAVTTTAFTTTSFTCNTGSTLTGGTAASGLVSGTSAGTATCGPTATAYADTTGGSKSVTATGATSGLTASTTVTIKPWAAFYDSSGGLTTYSFVGTAPTSLLIEVHGMPAGTVAANSITVGGVATSHASFTIGSSGAVGGAGGQIIVSPTGNVPFGQANVVVAGNTFSYAAGNIAIASGTWGGVVISSIIGTSGTSTGVASIDASSYKPGAVTASKTSSAPAQNQIGFFGYGFVAPTTTCTGNSGGVISIATPTGVTFSSGPTFFAGTGSGSPAHSPDCNGAFFATAGLGDTPWSTAAAPTTAVSYSPTVSQAPNAPANILSPSFGITPWTTGLSSTVDYTTLNANFAAHGFSPNAILTMTIGGSAAGATCTATGNGACTTTSIVTSTVPDLAGGPQNVVISDSLSGQSVTTTGGATYDPRITGTGPASCSTTCTLNIQSGPSGSTTIIRTGTGFGVHGLLGNTAYRFVWNGQTGLYFGFTTTATGGIPVPGVQIVIPSDTSGLHIIDIQTASGFGTSSIYGGTLVGDYFDNDAGLTTTQNTQFGDMLFSESTSLIATPTVANVGGSVGLTGSGLAANTLYDLGVTQAGTGAGAVASVSVPPTVCPTTNIGVSVQTNPAAPTSIAGFFTSTSTGTVPGSTSLALTDIPTVKGLEQGTLYCVYSQTAASFGGSTASGVAEFELQANANLNMTSAPSGHNVVLSAHALAPSTGYDVLFAPYACGNSGSICGTVVGAILSNAQGAGSGTFTVPSTIQTSAGSQPVSSGSGYTIELQSVGSSSVALASPPTVTVGSASSTTCQSTTCMTVSGSSSTVTIGGNKAIQTSFTNNSNAPVTAIIYAVVHNAAGQTVYYTTATITAPAGGSATAYNVLFGLPSGTYSVTIFATTTSGVAISSASTVSVTL
jgi:hypothetical protein